MRGDVEFLKLKNRWCDEGRCFVRWVPESQSLLRKVKHQLNAALKPHLSGRCAHLKGRGGAKGAIRLTHRLTDRFRFVARLDIRGYYDHIDHAILLGQLREGCVNEELQSIVRDYLRLPDSHQTGCGMVAGGAISPFACCALPDATGPTDGIL